MRLGISWLDIKLGIRMLVIPGLSFAALAVSILPFAIDLKVPRFVMPLWGRISANDFRHAEHLVNSESTQVSSAYPRAASCRSRRPGSRSAAWRRRR